MYKRNLVEVGCSSFIHLLIMLRFFICFKQHTLQVSFYWGRAHGNAPNIHWSIVGLQSLTCSLITTHLCMLIVLIANTNLNHLCAIILAHFCLQCVECVDALFLPPSTWKIIIVTRWVMHSVSHYACCSIDTLEKLLWDGALCYFMRSSWVYNNRCGYWITQVWVIG